MAKVYRYRFGGASKLKGAHGILREFASVENVRENVFIDITVSNSEAKKYIDMALYQEGYSFYADVTSVSGIIRKKKVFSNEDYSLASKADDGQIQFTQIELRKDVNIVDFETFIDEQSETESLSIALYSQQEPNNPDGLPHKLLSNCADTSTTQYDNEFINIIPTGNYLIPYNGKYWIAFMSSNDKCEWASTLTKRKGFIRALWMYRDFSNGFPTVIDSQDTFEKRSSVIYAAINVEE